MYIALLALLLILGGALTIKGVRDRRPQKVLAGASVLVLSVLFFALLSFWGEMLWFESIGYGGRFWTAVWAKIGASAAGLTVGGLGVYLLISSIPPRPRVMRIAPAVAGAFVGGLWGVGNWEVVLKYLYQVPAEIRDPVFQRDVGFYLFTLPFYDALYWLFLLTGGIALATAVLFARAARDGEDILGQSAARESNGESLPRRIAWLPLAAVAVVVAWGQYLSIYHLLYSRWGVVNGAGWTDVYIRLPAHLIIAGVILVVVLLSLVPAVYSGIVRRLQVRGLQSEIRPVIALGGPWVVVFGVWFLALGVAPRLAQWLYVEPNEITVEAPYIARQIDFTRQGFQLDKVEERQFPVSPVLTEETVNNNQHLLSEVRLWDWRALDAVYRQFQEIRLYYEFSDVDIDRYHTSGGYRQVMVSAREMELSNLPQQSQTFVNRRFIYTHGYGLTLAPVSEFTEDGLPNLLVKDIPPQAEHPELKVERPEIYFGERTVSPVFVNSHEPEFDYPSGDENVYTRYAGSGGVQVTNLWRKFVFGWKTDGTRLLLSTYPTPETRVLFHRQIRERVGTLAPFLQFDADPYVVLVEGKLYWVIDGYTTSQDYPYSEHFAAQERIEYRQAERERELVRPTAVALAGANYVRNSVKAVVDAFNGAVTFYVFEPEDPLILVWQRIFPELFKPQEEMPAALRAHVRYPIDFLLTQGLVYAKYHMTDPGVFYNQEDLWIRATEKYYGELQPVEPYYVMWEPPESQAAEFILMLPFTPKNRQVLIGWLAGMCDPDNYGRLLAYQFPKEERILGTQQVETKIDQDSYLSAQLSLWDQRGSRVIRGNVLVLPIDKSLLYVEPIYLQAEAAAYPELRLVVLMHGDELSYAETFEQALQGLLKDGEERPLSIPVEEFAGEQLPLENLVPRANEAFENYLRLQAEKNFAAAAEELARLRDILQRLAARYGS